MGEQNRHGTGVASRIRGALRTPAVVVGGETVGELRERMSASTGPRSAVVVEGDDTRVLDPLTVLRSRAADDEPAVTLWCCEPAVHDVSEDVTELLSAVMGRTGDHQGHDLLFQTDEGPQVLSLTAVTAILAESNAVAVRLDSLTGLPGRVAVHEALATALRDRRGPVAVAFLDLDGFDDVNHEHGQAVGDRVLQLVARRLRNGVREGDVVGRVGGDDFLAVLSANGVPEARTAVERLVELVVEPVELDDVTVSVSASVGVAMVDPDEEIGPDTIERTIADADALMFLSKQRGGGVVVEGDADDLVVTRSQLEDALASEQLELMYQPIIPLDGSPSVAVEALVRWPLPDGEPMLPSAFVPLAEATGQIVDLDWWALAAAVVQLTAWNRSEQQNTPHAVHVNLSALTLKTPGLTSHVERLLRTAGVEPERLTVEITESDVVADVDCTHEVLQALRDLGVRTAVDDFGIGRASLAQLSQLPLSALKIDRAFVEQLARSEADRSIVRVVRVLADEFGLEVVAEGVESLDQADALRELGITHAQGWLWSAAVDADTLGAAPVDPERVAPTPPAQLTAIADELSAVADTVVPPPPGVDEHVEERIAPVEGMDGWRTEDDADDWSGADQTEKTDQTDATDPTGQTDETDPADETDETDEIDEVLEVDQVDAIADELFGDQYFGDETTDDAEDLAEDEHAEDEQRADDHAEREPVDGDDADETERVDEDVVDDAVAGHDPDDADSVGEDRMPAPPTTPPASVGFDRPTSSVTWVHTHDG